MRRPALFRPATFVVTLVAALALTGCGSSDDNSTGSPQDTGTTIEVTIKDGNVTPNGDRIKVAAGSPITFKITSDVAGEMHVHSTPEQSLDFAAGETTDTITLDQPQVAAVELHDPALTVVQLQVS